MFDAGLVDEGWRLFAGPPPLSRTARQAVGYPEVIEHLEGSSELAETSSWSNAYGATRQAATDLVSQPERMPVLAGFRALSTRRNWPGKSRRNRRRRSNRARAILSRYSTTIGLLDSRLGETTPDKMRSNWKPGRSATNT